MASASTAPGATAAPAAAEPAVGDPRPDHRSQAAGGASIRGEEAGGRASPGCERENEAESLSRRSRGWGDEHLARLRQGHHPSAGSMRAAVAERGARESAGESQATRDLLAFRRLLAAHMEDQMVLARTSAWMQVQAYLVQWTRAAAAAADAAEAAAASFGGSLRQRTGLPPPVAMPAPWSMPAHLQRDTGHRSPLKDAGLVAPPPLSAAGTQPGAATTKDGATWWTEAGGFSVKLLQAKTRELPEVLPCAGGPAVRAASWPPSALAKAKGEIGDAFPAASRFLRKLWELVAVGPRTVVEFLPDGGFVVRDMGAFAASVKDAFNSEPTSFSRQIHKYGLRLRRVAVQHGGRASLSNAWRAGRSGSAAWWHPMFLNRRPDLLPFVTPRNPNGYGPARYIGPPSGGAASIGGAGYTSDGGRLAASEGAAGLESTPRTLAESNRRAEWAAQTKAAAAGVWSGQSGRFYFDDDNADDADDLDDVDEVGDDDEQSRPPQANDDDDDDDGGSASSRLGSGTGGSPSACREDYTDDGDDDVAIDGDGDDGRRSAPSRHVESAWQGTPRSASGRGSAAGSQRRASKRGRRSAGSGAGPESPTARPTHGVTMPWDSEAASFRPVARSSGPPAKRQARPEVLSRVAGGGAAYGPSVPDARRGKQHSHAKGAASPAHPPELTGPPSLRPATAPVPTPLPSGSAPGVLLPGPFDADSTVRPAELRRLRKATEKSADELAALSLSSTQPQWPGQGPHTPQQGHSQRGGATSGLVPSSLVPASLSASSLPIATSDTLSLQSGLAPPSLFGGLPATSGSLGAAAMRGLRLPSVEPPTIAAASNAAEAPVDWAALLPPAAPAASKGD